MEKDFRTADLEPIVIEKIKKFEKELQNELKSNIVVVAYKEDRGESN